MSTKARFASASGYQGDALALPVSGLDAASRWYAEHFGMVEVERREQPAPTLVLERDGVKIGFAVNGGDASQDGAAILVSGLHAIKAELEAADVKTGELRVDERNGEKFEVFFVVAPDGLCYYFHEAV